MTISQRIQEHEESLLSNLSSAGNKPLPFKTTCRCGQSFFRLARRCITCTGGCMMCIWKLIWAYLSIVVLWVIFLGRSFDCMVGAWESPFCLFDQAADNAPRHQTREHLSVHPPWAPTLVRVNMDERWWKLAKITVMIVLLVVLVVTDKLCIWFFLPCQWNLAALQFCRSTRCCEVGRSGSWSLGCRASVWQHLGNSRFLTEFRNDMKWHEMTIWQKWPILFWVKDGRAGCRMLQMFAASGVWQTYADVMGPIEAAFLVPIRTKPTPWLELRFICLQLLGRLRPTWLFFQTNSDSDFVLRHPGIWVKQTPHLKDSERTWKSMKVCIY